MVKKRERLQELDALRGLAALAVVLFHYTTRYDQIFGHDKPNYLSFKYGSFGVSLFFIISGFVIFMTIKKANNLSIFIKKRIIRLYPTYIVSVILTYLAVTIYGLQERSVSFGEALFNLTMLEGFIPSIGYVDGAYWSLTVELAFYVIIGVVLYLGFTNRIVTISIIWLVISVCVQIMQRSNSGFLVTAFVVFLITNYVHLFIAGIMFYLIRQKEELKYYLILVLCLIFDFVFFEIVSNIAVSFFFILFYLLIKDKLSFLKIGPLVYLGTISYSFYLVHQNIGYIIINFMEKIGLDNEIYLLVPIVISIFLATLITNYVEKPCLKYFSAKISRDKKINSNEIVSQEIN